MKAKSTLIFVLGIGITAVVLNALMSVIGVQITGPQWAQALAFAMIGFAGIGLWEFVGSVVK